MFKHKKILVSIFILISILTVIVPSATGAPFSQQPSVSTPQGPNNLAELIQQIFTWSLGILGISVFVMFFYSGFLWLTAAGNTSKIGEAKTHMTNAVFGAVLLLSSYLILYTINPDFVKNTVNLPGLGPQSTLDPALEKNEEDKKCEEEPIPTNSLLSDLQTERAKYGTELTHSDTGKLLNAVAWKNKDTGWGLLEKTSGNRCDQPGGPTISCDWLVHAPSGLGLDVLIDAPGTKDDGTLATGPANPTWHDGCYFEANKWVAPVQP